MIQTELCESYYIKNKHAAKFQNSISFTPGIQTLFSGCNSWEIQVVYSSNSRNFMK